MPLDYLSYWKPATVKHQTGILLDHSASDQYGSIQRGDTVWLVTVWQGGHLVLLGRIRVDVITGQREAERRLGTDDVWHAKYHIFPSAGDAKRMREVELSDVAELLRFESKHDRLNVKEGRVDAKQLQSMRRLTPETASILRTLWGEDSASAPIAMFPDELEPGKKYVEGAKKLVQVNAYERDPKAREACLSHHGYNCAVCGFNFEARYGDIGKEFIHVHHLKPLALTDGQYELDPIADLRPVCPNCHAMLHRGERVLGIEELHARLIPTGV